MKQRSCAALATVLLMGWLFAGCGNAPLQDHGNVVYFQFYISDGWTPPQVYTIEQDAQEGLVAAYACGSGDEWRVPLNAAGQQNLLDMLQKHRVDRWDGYDRSQNGCDMPGFGLEAAFEDGAAIAAKGYGAFPRGYSEAEKDLVWVFEQARYEYEREHGGNAPYPNAPDFEKLPLVRLRFQEMYSDTAWREYSMSVDGTLYFWVRDVAEGKTHERAGELPTHYAEELRAVVEEYGIHEWEFLRIKGEQQSGFEIMASYEDGSSFWMVDYGELREEHKEGVKALQRIFGEMAAQLP